MLSGVRYRFVGWVKESVRGKFLSLAVRDEQQPSEMKPAAKKLR
jgi:hypothetical protein